MKFKLPIFIMFTALADTLIQSDFRPALEFLSTMHLHATLLCQGLEEETFICHIYVTAQ